MNGRILIVDDEPQVLVVLAKALGAQGMEISLARNGREALRCLRAEHFNVTVLDLIMPVLNGLDVLRAIREEGIQTDVVVLTGHGTVQTATEAMRPGAADFVEKPLILRDLTARVQALIDCSKKQLHPNIRLMDQILKERSLDPDLRLEHIAEALNLSPDYVSRLFRSHFDMPFQRRLLRHRVQHAKVAIKTFAEPLKAIATVCGFRNQQRMTEAFTKLERMSPKNFRRQIPDRRKNSG